MVDFNVLNKDPAVEGEIVDADYPELKKKDPFDLEALKQAVVPFKAQVDEMVKKAMDFRITDAPSSEVAVIMGTQAKALDKKIDAERKRVIKSYDHIVKGINSTVKPFRDALKAVETTLKTKIAKYHREQAELARRIAEKKAREEAEQKRKEAEAARQADLERQEKERAEALALKEKMDAEAKAEGVDPVKVEIPEIVDPGVAVVVEETVLKNEPIRTETGTSSFIQKFKYKVIDIDKVPDELVIITKSIDDKKVKEAIDAGIRQIDGLDIYEDYDVRFRTK